MSHTFISYAREDINTAEQIVKALAENDLNTWVDWKSIPKAEDWREGIFRGIEEADSFLFLISIDSVTSQVCNEEIDHALKNGKRIIPILIGNTKDGRVYKNAHEITNNFIFQHLKSEINRRNFIFCRENLDDFSQSIEQIKSTIRTDYKWLEDHTNLQLKALEWKKRNKKGGLLSGTVLREAQELITLSGQKDPQPTDLQRLFVNESQKTESHNRNLVLTISGIVITTLAFLALFANNQRLLALDNAATAQAAQLEAENQKATAIANEEEAKRQANIAIARSLILEAKSLNSSSVEGRLIRGLLGILSMKLSPSGDGMEEVQNITYTKAIQTIELSSDNINDYFYVEAISSDGKYIATTILNGEFQLWDMKSGDRIQLTPREINNVTFAAFSPDDQYLAIGIGSSSEGDSGIQVYKIETKNKIQTIPMIAQEGPILFTSDSQYITTFGYINQGDKGFCVWNVLTGIAVNCISYGGINAGYTVGATPIAISPDGNFIATASNEDKTVRLWDVNNKQELFSYTFNQFATSVIFSHDGKRLIFSGCNDVSSNDSANCIISSIKVIKIETLTEDFQMTHEGSMSPIAISPDDQFIASGSFGSNGSVVIWNAITGNQISQLEGTINTIGLAFSPDSKYLATGGRSAQIWESATGNLISELLKQTTEYGNGHTIVFSPDSETLFASEYPNIISVSKIGNPIEVKQITTGGGVFGVNYSPDGKLIAFAEYYDQTVRVWDIDKGQEVFTRNLDAPVFYTAFSPNNSLLAASSNDGTIRIWNIDTGDQIFNLQKDKDISPLIFSADGTQIISGNHTWDIITSQEILGPNSGVFNITSYNSSMYIYLTGGIAFVVDRNNGNEIQHKNYSSEITLATLSPNDQYAATSECKERDQFRNCQISIIHIWDILSGEEISSLPYLGDVLSIHFSPDGKYIASSPLITSDTQDGAIDIWDIATRKIIYHLGGSSFLRSAGFSPDGDFIVAIDCEKMDGNCTQERVRIVRWQIEDIIKIACERMPRNLTQIEWDQYIGNSLPYQAVCDNLPIGP